MLAIRYSIFAVIATILNLFAQGLFFLVYSGYGAIYMALALGTLVGLIAKYLLDKYYIFHSVTELQNCKKEFLLYSLVGGVTTLLFWGTELMFNYLYDSSYAKYVGGAIGLIIGYTIKYQLDKRFVFNQ